MQSSNFTYDEIWAYGDEAARDRAEALQSWRERGWTLESVNTVPTTMEGVAFECSLRRVPEAAELAENRLDRETRNLIIGAVYDARGSEAADRVESALGELDSALASAAAQAVRRES